MNILVIGGGEPGKFGNDFVKKARAEKHEVIVLSHRKRHEDDISVNFTNIDDILNKVNNAFDHIDILLYNSSIFGYPNNENMYKSSSVINEKLYQYDFEVHVVIPHIISTTALKYMNKGKILFITTDMIHDRERDKYLEHVGYCGGKAWQHQLMLALAEYNDKDCVVSAISPMFDYNNKFKYKKVFDKAYHYILNADMNGKIYDCFDT